MAVARVISTKKFIVGVTNERDRERSQISDGKVEWVLELGRCLAMCDVMRGVLNRSH